MFNLNILGEERGVSGLNTLQLIVGNLPKIFLSLLPIIVALLLFRIAKRLVVRIVLIVVALILTGVISVVSFQSHTDFVIHGKEDDKTISVIRDGKKITGIEYDGQDVSEIAGKAKDAIGKDIEEIKSSGVISEITDSMKDGAQKGTEVLDWLKENVKTNEETTAGE